MTDFEWWVEQLPRMDWVVAVDGSADPLMWYSKMKAAVKIISIDHCGLWAREPGGYLNVIHFSDVAFHRLAKHPPAV